MKGDLAYLQHIAEAIADIENYLKGLSQEEFLREKMIQDAVLRKLEIIGEATKRLSEKIRKSHTAIPWKDVAGMRDKLIHDYLGVDLDEVWFTLQHDLPKLKDELQRIRKEQ